MPDRVLFQTDDDLDQTNLSEAGARDNATDYVERGLGLTADYGNLELDVGSGNPADNYAIVRDGNAAYDVFVEPRTGLTLTDSDINDVFVVVDPTTQDDVVIDVRTSGTPSDPYLKIGEVDTSNDTTTEQNREPDLTAATLEGDVAGGNSISSLLGAGLDVVSNKLRVLSSIWDGSAIVADVDNSAVTTDQVNNIHFADPADDAPGIQTLIDNAEAGDVIYLKSGTYEASKSYSDGVNVKIPSGKPIKLTGDEGATIRVPDGATDSDEGAKVITALADGTIIEDITIDGNQENQGSILPNDGHNITINADDCLVSGVKTINAAGDGVVVDGDRCRIIGPSVRNCFEMGIQFAAGQQGSLSGGVIRDTVNGANLMLKPSISENTLQDVSISAVSLLGGDDVGLAVKPGPGTVKNISLDNIYVRNAGTQNVFIGTGGSSQNKPSDISLSDIRSYDSAGYGMEISAIDDLEVVDCKIKGAQDHGIILHPEKDSGRVILRDNSIYDNNQSATSKVGILVDGRSSNFKLDYFEVVGNTIRGSHSQGINIKDLNTSSTGFVQRNEIAGQSSAEFSGQSGIDARRFGVRAYLGTNQSIPSDSGGTLVEFDNEEESSPDFDTDSHQYTAPRDGKYSITGSVTFTGSIPDGTHVIGYIFINGSKEAEAFQLPGGSDFYTPQIHDERTLSAGDTVEIRIEQESGSAVDIISGQNDTWMSVTPMLTV